MTWKLMFKLKIKNICGLGKNKDRINSWLHVGKLLYIYLLLFNFINYGIEHKK